MTSWISAGRVATLLLGLSMASIATADEPKVEAEESKSIKVTCPDPGLAVLRGSPMNVMGTIQVDEGAAAPDLVTFRFLNADDVEVGSHHLTLGQDNEAGSYKKNETTHLFSINLKAPTQLGACRLVVGTQRSPQPADADRTVVQEHAKPIKLEIK